MNIRLNHKRNPALHGFSLVELLVSIAVVAILSAIVAVSLHHVGTMKDKTVSGSNLKQIVTSMHLYAQDNNGYLPYQYDASRDLDWSAQLFEGGFISESIFLAPADTYSRRFDGEVRSYAINSATFTYLQNGYLSPWPPNRTARPIQTSMIPPTVLLVAENFGGAIENSGAVVGVAEFEGMNAQTYNFYNNTGALYGMADGSVVFKSKKEMDRYRADTDYNGEPLDPWKWKN